jgi:transposase-like protein
MANSILSAPHFHDEAAAMAFVEARVWPNGPVCPHCGDVERLGKLQGKSTRVGTWKCYECRKPFTVKVGTIFEDSPVKMHLWLQAIMLVAASKKGISANQLHRTLGVTLKTAWFMGHRIRHAMDDQAGPLMGSDGGVVEADETYIGRKRGRKVRAAWGHKHAVFSVAERNTGKVRSQRAHGYHYYSVRSLLDRNVSSNARLSTDEATLYAKLGKRFAEHLTVKHRVNEWKRGDGHTNTLEGYFSVFKRGMKGIYQHCSGDHLHRYLAEFDFRYNNRAKLGVVDAQRADKLIAGAVGKRLTYRTVNG